MNQFLSHDIFHLIAQIRPKWSLLNTDLVKFTGGINNTTYGLFEKENHSNGLVIKIFGSKTEEFIDRQNELQNLNILSKYGLAQPILIQFTNGYIYEYLPGEICSRDDIRLSNIIPLIAQTIAKLHSIPLDNQQQIPCLIPLMRKFLNLIDKNHTDLSLDEFKFIHKDVDWIANDILPRIIPQPQFGIDLVLCHNDIVCTNILYNSSISFIDFEYCALNYALFDIANHFVEYAGINQIDFDRYPTQIEQIHWLKIYFKTRNLPFNNPEQICHQIDQFAVLSHLCFGLWALAHISVMKLDSTDECFAYCQRRLNRYQQLKYLLQ